MKNENTNQGSSNTIPQIKQVNREVLHKEIDLIQACIKRMASNSFLIKGWSISLVAVVFALSGRNANISLLIALVAPLIGFWYLDAFFLYTERLYREMYKWVISKRLESDNESMYNLEPYRFKDSLKVKKWNKKTRRKENTEKTESEWTVMRSKTLICFYFIPILSIILIFIILFCNQSYISI